jgi:methionyl-tRNA formyltransferase
VRIAFAGTPEPAVPALHALLDSPRHDLVAVITRPPAPAGRGRRVRTSPVAEAGAAAGVPVLTPPSPGEQDFLTQLGELDVSCCAVVAYGALLPPPALAVPRYGWVNLHFSLLPAWRGAAPVQAAILHGDDITGATTFRIEEGLDTGPVFGVVTEAVRPDDTAGTLLLRLADSGAGLLAATLDGIEDGTLVPRPQPADGVSLARKLTPADGRVAWSAAVQRVDRVIRACTPEPGAWTTFRGERLKLGPVRVTGHQTLAPGRIATDGKTVRVGTATADVELGTVQPPGRRPMSAPDWARGARPAPDESFD